MNKKLTQLQERLELYYKAEKEILLRQKYRIGNKELTMADLSAVQEQIKKLETEISVLEKNGGKRCVKRVIPLDF